MPHRARRFLLCCVPLILAAPVMAAPAAEDPPRRPWQPAWPGADAPVEAVRCRIVSYAGKWTRHGLSNYMVWRHPNGPLAPRTPRDELFRITHDVDVDGDAATDDDYVASLPFSLAEPLSNPDWPMHMALPNRRSARFYGGVSWYVANSTPQAYPFYAEMGYNPDHSPPWYDGRAEDHPLHGQANERRADSVHRNAWAILWRKADFLNAADRGRVSLDESSRLASITARDYWMGFDDVRMIVGDPCGLWISDTEQFDIPSAGYKPAKGRVFLLRPTEATWAPYKPQGHHILFDADAADFAPRRFDDVRAVGWYVAKTNLEGKQSHLKWYGFEADAVVRRPAVPSVHQAMVPVPHREGVPAFHLAACETPYALWKDIHRYGDAPFHTLEARYVYTKAGDMGSMLLGEHSHGPHEPATNVTWYDALAICNTLSEMEGRRACYYVDPNFREPFRNMHIATRAVAPPYERRNLLGPTCETVPPASVYVDWAADGYRLPTPAEWLAAWRAGKNRAAPAAAWLADNSGRRTHDVGTRKADALGLHDLAGNVWELTWPHGDVYDPAAGPPQLAIGGGFDHPRDPTAGGQAASPYGDAPHDGSCRIGVRMVRRRAGLAAPARGPVPDETGVGEIDGAPAWRFGPDTRTAARRKPAEPAGDAPEMIDLPGGTFHRFPDRTEITVSPLAVARTHTTYAQWKRVLQWAEANGYAFARTGDMGNMYYFLHRHGPDEPVTRVTWHDAVVWCNALSEMLGRTPCYYTDPNRTSVYRRAFAWRALKVSGPETVSAEPHRYSAYSHLLPQPWVFTRWDADGFRLPTAAEFEYALRAGGDTPYFWGDNPAERDAHAWHLANAGGRTHPVGRKKPNAFGLLDMQGNAYHWLHSARRGADPTRPPELDVRNPKADPFWNHGKPREMYGGSPSARIVGGSWLCGGARLSGSHGISCDSQNRVNLTFAYADLGFRVVRCEAGTHPRDGLEPLADWPVVLDIDANDYDPLAGAAYRGSLARTGCHATRGPRGGEVAARWTFDTGGAVRSSPVVVGGVVYVGSDGGHFHAIRARDGEELWRLAVPGGVTGSPCVAGGSVYFGGNDGALYAVEAETGEVRWRAPGRGQALATSPAVAYGTVFVEGCWGFDAATGRQVWATTKGRLRGGGTSRLSSAALVGGRLYHDGSAAEIATARYAIGRGDAWAGHNTDPVAGSVMLALNSGLGGAVNLPDIRALDADSGRLLWRRPVAAPGQSVNVRKVLLTSPAVWDGRVYLGFDGGLLFCLDLADGQPRWTFDAGAPIRSCPSVSAADGGVYFGCHDGTLYALDARTGRRRWTCRTGGKILSSPWPAAGTVYVGSDDGKLHAVSAAP